MADQDFDIASDLADENLDGELDDDQFSDESDERRRRWIPTLIVIIIVIIAWLSLRDCGGGSSSSKSEKDTVTIGIVDGMQVSKGLVSVWLNEGASLKRVCSAAGVRYSEAIDMGTNKWVIVVRPGREKSSADLLAAQDGVRDAGMVWERETDDR